MVYNPLTAYTVTDDWNAHIARGAGGGIDYAMPVGTPLPASADGVLTNIPDNGTAGNVARITHPDGTATEYKHLSQFTTPRKVKQGDIIGYSGGAKGAPGAGNSTGPHVHVNDLAAAGTRVPPFTTGSGTGTGTTGNPFMDALNQLTGNNGINPITILTGTLSWWTNRQNQIRVAYAITGSVFIIIALVALFARSEAGQTIIETGKQGVRDVAGTAATAAKVAVLAP